MKSQTSKTAKVNVQDVNAKFAKCAEIVKAEKSKGKKRTAKVTKVTKVSAPVAEVLSPEAQLDAMRNELLDAQAKFESAKSPNTKKKYAKLAETILDDMKVFSDANKPAEIVAEVPVTTGSAPMTEKVRLADLPIGSAYKYRDGGAIYKLLKVEGNMIEAAESNGKTFTAKAANYKVFQVIEEAAQ